MDPEGGLFKNEEEIEESFRRIYSMAEYILKCNDALRKISNIPTNNIFDSRSIAKIALSRFEEKL